jgi:hypothetical protein
MAIRSFKDFRSRQSITFVDIDETLFRTFAKILVRKDGKIVRKLDNQEFNTYELKDGEEFDFREFKSASIFKKTSIPIKKTISILQKIYKASLQSNSDVYLLTARADLDDKNEFIDTLRKNGIPAGHGNSGLIHVLRAGNLKRGKGSAGKKKMIIRRLLKQKPYKHVVIFDDDISNLKGFMEIARKHPVKGVLFNAYLVEHSRIKRYASWKTK